MHEAVQLLEHVPFAYGINLTELHLLKPIMAALKVLAAAMVQRGILGDLSPARGLSGMWNRRRPS